VIDLACTACKLSRGKISGGDALTRLGGSAAGMVGSAGAGTALSMAGGEAALATLAATGLAGSMAAVAIPAVVCAVGAFFMGKVPALIKCKRAPCNFELPTSSYCSASCYLCNVFVAHLSLSCTDVSRSGWLSLASP